MKMTAAKIPNTRATMRTPSSAATMITTVLLAGTEGGVGGTSDGALAAGQNAKCTLINYRTFCTKDTGYNHYVEPPNKGHFLGQPC